MPSDPTRPGPSSDNELTPALSSASTLFDEPPGTPPRSKAPESSISSPVRHRPAFARITSVIEGDQRRYSALRDDDEITVSRTRLGGDRGLGISYESELDPKQWKYQSGATVVGSESTAYKGASSISVSDLDDEPLSPYGARSTHEHKRSATSFQSSVLRNDSDIVPLRSRKSVADTLKTAFNDFAPAHDCSAHTKLIRPRASCSAITILLLSIYSTLFSCLFFVVAVRAPRYGKLIGSGGKISIITANVVTALLAKTIELSFATVFVAFLGQVLWRRALIKARETGISLAEIEMRSWVMQPGSMLTRFNGLKASIMSVMGVLSLLAALCALLYTTASESLVQPQLTFNDWQPKMMRGSVKSSVFNIEYIEDQCATPITADMDPSYYSSTCIEIEYASQAYHNYQRFINDWSVVSKLGNVSAYLEERPQGFALLDDNTTVTPKWIEIVDTENASREAGRAINNVTMAMPHAGVPAAARDESNGILQPEDLDGIGIYSLHASVPSPALNVLCANMNASELAPIVYEEWSNGTEVDVSTWPQQLDWYNTSMYLNSTVVDDLFGWGEAYGQPPPVFPKLPIQYNTILNQTAAYGREALYLLGRGGPGSDYVLCGLKAFLTPVCSTRYNVSSSGATLEAICEEESDSMQYLRSAPNATDQTTAVTKDWFEGAGTWANSLSLSTGIDDGNASNSRLLTQLILTQASPQELSANLPSVGEALAVMAGCTLLLGTQETPFVEFWNYSSPTLEGGQTQWFNASLRAQEYASGGNHKYQHGFFAVLAAVLLVNVMCLMYLLVHEGMVTDFSEPLNLFTLAVNSPPSEELAGACGSGPQGRQYKVGWVVSAAGDHLFIESKSEKEGAGAQELATVRSGVDEDGGKPSPVTRVVSRLSRATSDV